MSAAALITEASEAGLAAAHPPLGDSAYAVAPATADEKNTLVLPLRPIACWRVEDARFDFDSSFVLPGIQRELAYLARLRERHVLATNAVNGQPLRIYPPATLFGHADPVGADDYNKRLSGRRAQAVYALLTRQTALWEQLYSQPLGADDWGLRAIQAQLALLSGGAPPISGQHDAATDDAIRAFQKAQGLGVDGQPGPMTRAALFRAYMDALCGPGLVMNPVEDFIGRGADAKGKADYQGCGEFNPVQLFSKEEEARYAQESDHSARNAANAPNRRVLVLLFAPGTVVEPAAWPCPRAGDGDGACRKRLWSDGERRRGTRLPDARRRWEQSSDTFACRFYHRLVRNSPCERSIRVGYTRWDLEPVNPAAPQLQAEAPPADADHTLGKSADGILVLDEHELDA